MAGLDETGLIAWVLREAAEHDRPEILMEGLCVRLRDAGLPIWRLSIGTPVIDPTVRGISIIWQEEQPVSFDPTEHEGGEAIFQRSPIYTLLSEQRMFGRWRLGVDDISHYPLLRDLRSKGGTDFIVFMAAFAGGTALTGMGLSIATTARDGFEASHIAVFERLLPALSLAVFRISLRRAARNTLDTYLGTMTGQRVLAGEVRRGQGTTISAAILLADLAGFTTLADQHEPADVVAWLNEHLEAVGGPVLDHGGEILKFLGDGLLAVFPVDDAVTRPCPACVRALAAASQARAANAAVNTRRSVAGGPALRIDIALHFGDVVYGNVGTKRRLDFTTIGRAVNETSRIEKFCQEDHDLVVSDPFAARCGDQPFIPLGLVQLRGVAEPRELWALAENSVRSAPPSDNGETRDRAARVGLQEGVVIPE